MNLGTSDRIKARAMVQANANYSGYPRWLHMWNGVFWQSKSHVEGSERIDPERLGPLEDQTPPPVDDGATHPDHREPPGGFSHP